MTKKVILALFLTVVLVPAALATTVDFSFQNVSWSWSGGLNSQLQANSPTVAVNSTPPSPYLILVVGPASLFSGLALNSPQNGPFTFSSGGSISISDTNSGSIPGGFAGCGGPCFTGQFLSLQIATNGAGGLSFKADVVGGTISTALLAALGLPTVPDTYEGILSGSLSNGVGNPAVTFSGGGSCYNALGVCEIGSMDLTLHPVPEPGTLAMFGSGLIGVAGLLRRKFNL